MGEKNPTREYSGEAMRRCFATKAMAGKAIPEPVRRRSLRVPARRKKGRTRETSMSKAPRAPFDRPLLPVVFAVDAPSGELHLQVLGEFVGDGSFAAIHRNQFGMLAKQGVEG